MIKIKKELNCLRQGRKIQEKTKRNKSLQQYQKNTKKLIIHILNEETDNLEANILIHRPG